MKKLTSDQKNAILLAMMCAGAIALFSIVATLSQLGVFG